MKLALPLRRPPLLAVIVLASGVACSSGSNQSSSTSSSSGTGGTTSASSSSGAGGSATASSSSAGSGGSAMGGSGTATASSSGPGCTDACTLGTNQCSDAADFQVCLTLPSGCAGWSSPTSCPPGSQCMGGACLPTDPCMGVQCTKPPAALCVSATTLRTWSTPGTCSAGQCTYPSTDTTCPWECQAGRCVAPLLATMVTAGQEHTCALTSDGAVKCWGINTHGQLGDGTTNDSAVPVDVTGLSSGVVAVAAGFQHTCAVTSAGAVLCWGSNASGQLGDGTTTDRPVPTAVTGLSSGAAGVSGGSAHTCAVVSGGVQCWGDDTEGQLGDGTTGQSSVPLAVMGLSPGALAVAAGTGHTCAIVSGGVVQCWGDNTDGQLGTNMVTASVTPLAVTGLSSGAVAVAAGDASTCAITSGGALQCWGGNAEGQLGDGTMTSSASPVGVMGASSGVVSVTVAKTDACAAGAAGAQCWGFGFLGSQVSGDQSSVPLGVTGLSSGVASVSAGQDHACAVTSAGAIWCWGSNDGGNLGNASTSASFVPVEVVGF